MMLNKINRKKIHKQMKITKTKMKIMPVITMMGKKKMHKETDEEFFKNRTLSFEYP